MKFALTAALFCMFGSVLPLQDRLQVFYDRLKKSDVQYCPDRTKIMPDCSKCIQGLVSSGAGDSCDKFIKPSEDIRNEIKVLTIDRYPDPVPNRPFGLYPYLEDEEFIKRQEIFGKRLSLMKPEHVMDIGAYYNPINLFFDSSYCPKSVVIIEPILDPLSAVVPCPSSGGGPSRSTHYLVLPVTFRYYMHHKQDVPHTPDAVVCIGCDSHYGPNRMMLETAFQRPFTLLIEYPSEYVHNAAFRKMNGEGEGEKLVFSYSFDAKTNATKFTKRVMKVISYARVN